MLNINTECAFTTDVLGWVFSKRDIHRWYASITNRTKSVAFIIIVNTIFESKGVFSE